MLSEAASWARTLLTRAFSWSHTMLLLSRAHTSGLFTLTPSARVSTFTTTHRRSTRVSTRMTHAPLQASAARSQDASSDSPTAHSWWFTLMGVLKHHLKRVYSWWLTNSARMLR